MFQWKANNGIISPLIDNVYCSWFFCHNVFWKPNLPLPYLQLLPYLSILFTERQKELSKATICFSTACCWPCWASLPLPPSEHALVMATEASRWPSPVSLLPIAHLPSCGPSVASDTMRQTVMVKYFLLLVSRHLTLMVFLLPLQLCLFLQADSSLDGWIDGVLSCSVVSSSLHPHGLYLIRLLCPWNFAGKNTGLPFSSPGDLPDPGIKPVSGRNVSGLSVACLLLLL